MERDVSGMFRSSPSSPVAPGLPVFCDGLAIKRLPPRGVLNLRGDAGDASFVEAVKQATGVAMPLAANRWHGQGGRAILWLGPDEWLVLCEDGEAASLEKRLRAARPGDPWLSVVDLSQTYSVLRLSGQHVRALLAKGCPLDLHACAFGAGSCAQTVLAKARVLLRVVDGPAIECWFRNSFADYTTRWLLDASAEFRHPVPAATNPDD